MKLKERLVQDWYRKRYGYADDIDLSHTDHEQFLAGFEIALKLAAVRGRIAQLENKVVDLEIMKIGEQDEP